MKNFLISLTLLPLTLITFAQTNQTESNLLTFPSSPKILISKTPEIIDIKKIDLNKYIVINEFEAINVTSKTNISTIKIIGKIKVFHKNKKLKCNNLTIFVVNNEVKEIVGEGEIKFVDGKDLFEGEKFFYNVKTGKISLYNAKTKLDDQYYYADVMKQLSPTKFFFENVSFTKSDLIFPTYKVNAYRVWYYKGDYLISLNNSYQVGAGSFLYFPTYFELYRYTDIYTDFGLEKTIGLYIQNTFYLKDWFGKKYIPLVKIKFDHYERLGEYLGFEIPNVNIISNLSISAIIDLEYDKKYESFNNTIVNYIDQYGKNEYLEYRTFGWYYKINAKYSKSGTSINFSSEDVYDPYLPSKFSARREKLDIQKLIFPYENVFWSLPGPKQVTTRKLDLSYQYGISSLNLGIEWVYKLRSGISTTNTNSFGVVVIENKTNRYNNDYYRYELQRISGPYISYSATIGEIFSFSLEDKTTNISTNFQTSKSKSITNEREIKKVSFETDIFIITTNTITNITYPEKEKNSKTETNSIPLTNVIQTITTNLLINTNQLKKQTKEEKTLNLTTNISSIKWLRFNTTTSANISITPLSTFRIEDGTPLEDTFTHRENVTVNLNFFGLNDTISISSSLGIQNNNVWTRTENPLRKKQDDLNSIATLNLNNKLAIKTTLFDKTILKSDPQISFSHNLSYRITRPTLLTPDEDPYYQNITLHNIVTTFLLKVFDLSIISNDILKFLNFSSVTVSSSVSYNLLYLKNEIKYLNSPHYWTNKISNPISINISFGPIANYTVSYKIKLSNDNVILDPIRVSISGGITIRDIILNRVIQKLNYINTSYSISFDYVNPINNSIILNLSLGGIINEYWSFAISTSIVNTKIYKYVPEYAQRYNTPYVDPLKDIIDSINVFDINALKRTNFKNKGVSLSLQRDLYDWVASISGGIRLYKDEIRNFAFFEPFVKFEITSKKNIGINVPPIQPELYRLFE